MLLPQQAGNKESDGSCGPHAHTGNFCVRTLRHETISPASVVLRAAAVAVAATPPTATQASNCVILLAGAVATAVQFSVYGVIDFARARAELCELLAESASWLVGSPSVGRSVSFARAETSGLWRLEK